MGDKLFAEWSVAYGMGLDPDAWIRNGDGFASVVNQLIAMRHQMARQPLGKSDQLKTEDFIPKSIEWRS